jgi:SM-20-related protein
MIISTPLDNDTYGNRNENATLFKSITKNIANQGYSIHPNALSPRLLSQLVEHLQRIPASNFKSAGIGRESNHMLNDVVRTDAISWINDESLAGEAWLHWADSLQSYVNRHLFMGLFSFESHFAHYTQGDFYKKHQDAFKGEANRVLSVVVYLNREWLTDDGGELVIYTGAPELYTLKVLPNFGTLVVFLSEDIPHEVLMAKRDRFSIAGWFRVRQQPVI